jgi:hypothetical protein
VVVDKTVVEFFSNKMGVTGGGPVTLTTKRLSSNSSKILNAAQLASRLEAFKS